MRRRRTIQLARECLLKIAETSDDWSRKALALEALVKLFPEDESSSSTLSVLMRHIMTQMEKAPDWVARCSAAQLLSYLGASRVILSGCFDAVFHLLEDRLSQDPIREVRVSLGRAIMDLKLYSKVFTKISEYLFNFISNII